VCDYSLFERVANLLTTLPLFAVGVHTVRCNHIPNCCAVQASWPNLACDMVFCPSTTQLGINARSTVATFRSLQAPAPVITWDLRTACLGAGSSVLVCLSVGLSPENPNLQRGARSERASHWVRSRASNTKPRSHPGPGIGARRRQNCTECRCWASAPARWPITRLRGPGATPAASSTTGRV
jgi:hypothetical protein